MKIKVENKSINEVLSELHLSKTNIYKIKQNGFIKTNYDYDTTINDYIEIDIKEDLNYNPEDIKLDVIYEDEYILAVNKPRGIIIHDESNSLCNGVAKYFIDNKINSAIRFPSRLDKDTTGVVIFAKNLIVSAYLDYLFSNDLVIKKYIALAKGKFSNLKGEINYNIGSDRHINGKMVTCKNGKKARTIYKVIKNDNISLVELTLKTGRTHQIRVHLSKINHPILGDSLYGDGIGELMLHCKSIEYINFDGKKIEINADTDSKFNSYIDKTML